MVRAVLSIIWLCLASLPLSADPVIDALLAGYPAQLRGFDGNELIFRDGRRLPISDGHAHKSFAELLANPSIKDQFAIPYPLGPQLRPPGRDEDPGRIRNEAFFLNMYGDCRKGEIVKHLKAVPWLPNRGGGVVMATTVNGVADRLAEVARALEALPANLTPYLIPSAGTYNCRHIAGTQRLSVHAFGAAIDLSSKFGDYWRWSPSSAGIVWRNRIPQSIVEIFEGHGFIWGGKWYHFDTLHFEYRPEIIALAKQGWPQD